MSDREIRAGVRAARATGVNLASFCTPQEICEYLASVEELGWFFVKADPGQEFLREIEDACEDARDTLEARRHRPRKPIYTGAGGLGLNWATAHASIEQWAHEVALLRAKTIPGPE